MVVLAICTGCDSPAQRKKAAREKWEKASARIKLALAQQQCANAKYDQAEETIRECLSADPAMPQAHLLLAKLLLAQNDRAGGVSELQAAVEFDKELHEAWYWLGLTAQQDKDYQQAYDHYTRALSLEPANVEYILAVAETQVTLNNSSEAVKLLTQRMSDLPRNVSLTVAAADLMLRVGKDEEAIRLYRQAMLLTADNNDIAEALGYAYVFSGKWREGAEVFEKLLQQCRDEQAKKMYLQVVAMCSMNSGRYEKALHYYRDLTAGEQDNAEIWVKMGQAALGAGMTGRALVCANNALALRPDYADAIALVGCAKYASADYAGAAESFGKITVDENSGGFSLLMKARCYERLGRKKEAEQTYKKALQLNPNSKLGAFLAKGKDGQSW
jgi:tetratricopeptide (TPR) repeat protein